MVASTASWRARARRTRRCGCGVCARCIDVRSPTWRSWISPLGGPSWTPRVEWRPSSASGSPTARRSICAMHGPASFIRRRCLPRRSCAWTTRERDTRAPTALSSWLPSCTLTRASPRRARRSWILPASPAVDHYRRSSLLRLPLALVVLPRGPLSLLGHPPFRVVPRPAVDDPASPVTLGRGMANQEPGRAPTARA